MGQQLLTPQEIATRRAGEIPFLRLPERKFIFMDRAARLRNLAAGSMGGYLEFIALVADEQQNLLDNMPPIRLPSPEHIKLCNEHGIPPLNFQAHLRDQQWCNGLRHLLHSLTTQLTGRLHAVASDLERARDEFYEAQASKLLAGTTAGLDIAAAPLIGAGLQVYFTHLAIMLGDGAFPPIDVASICPCCGSRPTASVARIGGQSGYRFLHCSLCNAEWHMVRIKCSYCESTKGISYQTIEDSTPANKKAVNAEICEECSTYLKICSMQNDPHVDPVADDLATVALDLLLSENGKTSSGVNFMLVHGDTETR